MLQRIQSIYLLLAAVCLGLTAIFPFATIDNKTILEAAHPFLKADQTYNWQDSITLLILPALGALICLITIFLFRNRKLQINSSRLSLVLSILIPIGIYVFFELNEVGETTLFNTDLGIGSFLFAPAIIFLFLAMRNIRKDDKLVRSMDRLR